MLENLESDHGRASESEILSSPRDRRLQARMGTNDSLDFQTENRTRGVLLFVLLQLPVL